MIDLKILESANVELAHEVILEHVSLKFWKNVNT